MNIDESSGPNGSITSMPDHSFVPGDFHNNSMYKSSAVPSPNASMYQRKKETSSAHHNPLRAAGIVPTGQMTSILSDPNQGSLIQNSNMEDSGMRNPYSMGGGGVRERMTSGGNLRSRSDFERSQTGSSDLQTNFQSNLSPFVNNEQSDVEVDQSYQTFLKLKRIYVYWVFNIICVFVMALNIYFAYSTDEVHFKSLENVEAQFGSHLIIDMNLVEKTTDCSGLYTSTSMGRWDGYDDLCQCHASLTPGKCTSAQKESGCRETGPFAPMNISYWEGKRICVRKSEGTIKEYYQKLIVNPSGEGTCEGDLKKCVVSSNGNTICMGRFEFCPVTQIVVADNTLSDAELKKWKGQLHFKEKTLLFENEENKGTGILDIVLDKDECVQYKNTEVRQRCQDEKLFLDRMSEYQVLQDNAADPEKYSLFQNLNTSLAIYAQPAGYLDMCKFNKTFNPVILSNELANWDRVKTLRFINPFFICSLLILSFVRTSVLDYLNTRASARILIRRKKELYNIFGFFTGSSVMITCQVLIILYYIFWGYLLLNQSRLIGQRWLDMACVHDEIRSDIETMMGEISKVEAYNMITIGPMIICCILEALFAQYKMIDVGIMNQLRD